MSFYQFNNNDTGASESPQQPQPSGLADQQEMPMNEESADSDQFVSEPLIVADGNNKKQKPGLTRKGSVIMVACCLAFSAAAAIIAGSIAVDRAEQRMQALLAEADTGVIYRNVETTVNAASVSAEPAMSVSDVVDVSADSVVEISIEVVTNYFGFGESIAQGAGSGVIISDNGYIITNNHVVADASTIRVILRNGEEYEATLVGRDEETDIAVIKIEAEDLTPAVFGSSDDLLVGDRVVAIGNPLGSLGGTVTVGYVSALDREINIADQTMTLLQTDATINSGNSGGGLFNTQGELVGIAVAYASGIGVQGLNFFIPVDDIMDELEDLLNFGYVRNRVSLGVYLLNISDERTAMSYRVDDLGVYILQFNGDNSNAEKAGLVVGDMIVSIDGQSIQTAEDIQTIIQEHDANDTISVVVKRDGEEKSFEVMLYEEVPESADSSNSTLL